MASKASTRALLLLPVTTSPWTRLSLQTACGPSISSALSIIAQSIKDNNSVSRLDIGVVLPQSWHSPDDISRSSVFPKIEKLLEELYTVSCVIAAQDGIDLDFPGGVDARIFLLKPMKQEAKTTTIEGEVFSGPLIDLPTLVTSGRFYDAVFSVESEEGEGALKEFLKLKGLMNKPFPATRRVPGGTAMSIPEISESSEAEETAEPKCHLSVAVGGTFDHLHIGHKLLLTATALAMEPKVLEPKASAQRLITIGITGDELLTKKKYANQVESWEDRQEKTAEFFESVMVFEKDPEFSRVVERIDEPGPNGKLVQVRFGSTLTINYVQISDPYGPTITDENISALVISKETRAGGKAVNEKREEKGWPALEVFEVDVLDAKPSSDEKDASSKDAFESKISSTEIRRRIDEKQKDD